MCKLISFAISVEPFGAAKAFTKCETHNWPVDGPVSAEYLCPLGRIEKAVDEGVARLTQVGVIPLDTGGKSGA